MKTSLSCFRGFVAYGVIGLASATLLAQARPQRRVRTPIATMAGTAPPTAAAMPQDKLIATFSDSP